MLVFQTTSLTHLQSQICNAQKWLKKKLDAIESIDAEVVSHIHEVCTSAIVFITS